MKKIIVITGILLLAFSGVKAQQLINGEKAPELKLSEWISKNQLQSGKPTLIEFFFSRSDLSMKRLPTVDEETGEESYEVLFTTGLIPPGQYCNQVTLTRALEPGEYNVILHVQPYRMSDKTPTNNADTETVLIVE